LIGNGKPVNCFPMSANAKLKLEVDGPTAKLFLAQMEQQLATKRQSRDVLSVEIEGLETGVKSLREQLLENGSESGRAPRGDNRARIREYLSKIPNGKGARASEITKDTGIGASSTAFTLSHYKDDFQKDVDTKRWKVKNNGA
jgi:hypothetical protein